MSDCMTNEAGECINEGSCMHDAPPEVPERLLPPPPVPAELVPQTISFWDAQLRTIMGLAREVADDLTTKRRLQQIAKICILQLVAMTEAAKAEEEAQMAAADQPSGQPLPDGLKVENRIIVPDTRLVVP